MSKPTPIERMRDLFMLVHQQDKDFPSFLWASQISRLDAWRISEILDKALAFYRINRDGQQAQTEEAMNALFYAVERGLITIGAEAPARIYDPSEPKDLPEALHRYLGIRDAMRPSLASFQAAAEQIPEPTMSAEKLVRLFDQTRRKG